MSEGVDVVVPKGQGSRVAGTKVGKYAYVGMDYMACASFLFLSTQSLDNHLLFSKDQWRMWYSLPHHYLHF